MEFGIYQSHDGKNAFRFKSSHMDKDEARLVREYIDILNGAGDTCDSGYFRHSGKMSKSKAYLLGNISIDRDDNVTGVGFITDTRPGRQVKEIIQEGKNQYLALVPKITNGRIEGFDIVLG